MTVVNMRAKELVNMSGRGTLQPRGAGPNLEAGVEGRALPPGAPPPASSVQGQSSDGVQAASVQQPMSAQQALSTNGITLPGLVSEIGNPPTSPENLEDAAGRRVRLRFKPGAGIGNSIGSLAGIMAPIKNTKGMVFPYQPTITYNQEVVYQNMELVHANQDFHVYTRTPALKLQVDGDFTVQSQEEGLYALASIHFLRTVTKMYFGGTTDSAKNRQGTPPPVLLFDAYGQYMFNSLPVIVTQFTVNLPKDVDYVPVKFDPNASNSNANPASLIANQVGNINKEYLGQSTTSGYAWLPAQFNMSVQLTVQNTPQRLRAFDLDLFRTGQLLTGGTWV